MFTLNSYLLEKLIVNHDNKRIPLSSKQREKRQGKYPYYGAQGIIDYIDDYIFDGNYILLAEDGENLRSKKQNIANIALGKFWVNNHAHVITNSELTDFYFLYYLLNSIDISGYVTGSTQPKLSQNSMNSIEVKIPDIKIQERIGSILLSIDKKIELNTQINRNLEQQAQAIFKSWFVDFEPFQDGKFIDSELGLIPEGWKVGTLNEIAFYNNEKLPASQASLDTYISTENMLPNRGGIALASSVPLTGNITAFTKNDVLLSNIRPYFRKIWYASLVGTCSTDVLCFRAKRKEESEYLFCVLNDEMFFEYIMSGAKGTKMPRGDKRQMMSYRIMIPTYDILENYSQIMKPFFENQRRNTMESYRLATLRDTLLPRLMSGEIDVSEVEV